MLCVIKHGFGQTPLQNYFVVSAISLIEICVYFSELFLYSEVSKVDKFILNVSNREESEHLVVKRGSRVRLRLVWMSISE